MKNVKRILVAMLAFSLLASAFIFSAYAEETNPFHNGMTAIEDILEYYTLDDYLADNYNDGTWNTELFSHDTDYDHSKTTYKDYPYLTVETADDPAGSGDKVLAVTLPFNKKAGYNMEDKGNILTDKLFLTFEIYFAEESAQTAIYELKVGTVPEEGRPASTQSSIMKIDLGGKSGDPSFTYQLWNEDTQKFSTDTAKLEGMIPTTGVWYDIIISFDASDDVYSFNITNKSTGETASTGDLSMKGAAGIWGFNCQGQYSNSSIKSADRKNTKALYYLNDMEIYEGTYVRQPSLKDEITIQHLDDLEAIYTADADAATKLRIADVLDFLYGLDADAFTDEVRASMPDAQKFINETYAYEFVTRVAAIDTEAGYYERVEYLAKNVEIFDVKLPEGDALTGLPGIPADTESAIKAARAAYATEIAVLNEIKTHSEGFINYITDYDPANKEYDYIVDVYTTAASDAYTSRYENYEGMADATAIFEGLTAKYDRMVADVAAYIAAVDAIEAATTLGPKFVAYSTAKASYFKYDEAGVINPDLDNSTNATLAASIAYYLENEPQIVADATECDNFNDKILEAKVSSYYTSIVEKLTAATEMLPNVNTAYEADYPGITESIALYNALNEVVAADVDAVTAYTAAVNAIATKTNFYDKKAAVEAALVLKETGDVLGVEGVKELNIELAKAEAEINYLEGNSKSLIALVAELADATTLAERRVLIHSANSFVDIAENTYEGVAAAKTALTAAIEAFNADVNAANGAVASANAVAQSVATTVDGAKIFVEGK